MASGIPLLRSSDTAVMSVKFFEEEQNLLARLVHQLVSQDTDEHFELLRAARERFNAGGPKRLRHTLAPLAFAALRLVRAIKEGTAPSKKADGACKTVSASPRHDCSKYPAGVRSQTRMCWS